MINCPYNNCCIKSFCDLSCSEYSEFMHWMNRCDLTVKNPCICASLEDICLANDLIQKSIEDTNNQNSNYMHISVYSGDKSQYMADLTAYLAICKYCRNIGFYNGVYKLNFAKYLDEIKKSWNSRYNSEHLEDMKIWIHSSRYLIIYNLGLVRFGDFESQTLLSIFQDRYTDDKYTILALDKGKFSLPGKLDSLFYLKLKQELVARGAKL